MAQPCTVKVERAHRSLGLLASISVIMLAT
jgi:hypothetical protein